MDSFNCASSDTAVVFGNGVQVSIDVPSPAVYCPGQPVSLQAMGNTAGFPITYNWSAGNPDIQIIGGNSPNVTIKAPAGMHTVQLIASNGFCADTASASFTVRPAVEIELPGGSATVCADSVTLTLAPIGPVNVVWLNANQDTLGTTIVITLPVDSAVQYIVTAVDSFNCISTDTAFLNSAGINLSVTTPPPAALCAGLPVVLQAGIGGSGLPVNYSWSSIDPNVQIMGGNSSSVTVTAPAGTHVITVVAQNDFCIDSTEVTLEIQDVQYLDGDLTLDLCKGLDVGFSYTGNLPVSWDFDDNNNSNQGL
ncbi:MAG: PKD domain-containing protein [Lewinellaceae bacterium]|nr:PKD domain-containing protein [Lewinellaceae bacterium]